MCKKYLENVLFIYMYVYTRKIKLGTKEKKINVLVPSIFFLTYILVYIFIHTLQKESKQNVYNHLLTRLFSKNYETYFNLTQTKFFLPSLLLSLDNVNS